jgi:AcrR family transcriptional regulator
MSGKRGRGRPRREGADEEILAAVLEVLRERGYGSLTVDTVAERAGVAKTTIYRRWPSKGELAAAAIAPLLEGGPELDLGSVEAELTLLLHHVQELLSGELSSVLAGIAGEAQAASELAHLMPSLIEPQRRLLREAIARAVAKGELAAWADVELLIDVLIAPFWVRLLLRHGELPEPGDVVRTVLDGVKAR